MGDPALKDYAAYLIEEHATDIESLTIVEMADDFLGEELSSEDFDEVNNLLGKARLTITWPED